MYFRIINILYYLLRLPVIVALALTYISTNNTPARLCVVALLTSLTLEMSLTFSHCGPFCPKRGWDGLLMCVVWLIYVRSLDLLLLRRVSILQDGSLQSTAGQPRTAKSARVVPKTQSPARRILKGMVLAFNFRDINTPWQGGKKVNLFSSYEPSYVPSRSRFLALAFMKVVFGYIFVDLISNVLVNAPENVAQYKQRTFSRWHDVTMEEVISKIIGTFVTGTMVVCLVSSTTSAQQLFTVGLGLSNPADNPPFFGSIWDMWSIRQLWGRVWHQVCRSWIEAYSDFVVTGVVGIRKGTLVSRYSRLTICFSLSGLFHLMYNMWLGVPFGEDGTMRFFLMSAMGIIFEDAVQELYRRAGGKTRPGLKIVGAIWVILFFAWTLPTWTYPIARLSDPTKNNFAPVSILNMVKARLQNA